MREAIIRLNNKKDDAELCIKQNEKITFKMLSKEELVKLFNEFFIKDQHEKANIKLFSENTIGAGIDYTVISNLSICNMSPIIIAHTKSIFPMQFTSFDMTTKP